MAPLRALSPALFHTPWLDGEYGVAPNLRPLGDARALEFDTLWPRVRANKELGLAGRVLRDEMDERIASAVVRTLAARAADEWPDYFRLEDSLTCRLTGEVVTLGAEGLEPLAMNLPCDLAVVRRQNGTDWNAYLNVGAPSHWRPEEKIGRSFVASHAPIPGMERVNAGAAGLVEAMVARGPWVRYVWGMETDAELDHHPDRAPRRDFASKPFIVRVERQVTLPLPEHDAALFLIATGFHARSDVLAEERLWRPLLRALDGMSPAARAYKGVAEGFAFLRDQFPG